MKKRILSLAMAACLALSMMLTLSACGKKNLEEYFNTELAVEWSIYSRNIG